MKVLGAHQTYFFPYIGYFTILNQSDIYVHVDCSQYVKQSWMNRNRIIGEDGKIKYIIVPTKKNKQKTRINDIKIDYDRDLSVILNQLGYYRKNAPYYSDIRDLLELLFSKEYDNLSELCICSTQLVLERLEIKKDIFKLSDLDIVLDEIHEPDDLALKICKSFDGVDTYINAPGGKAFYNVSKYTEAGLTINFLQNNLRSYDQKNGEFIPGLSIIDVMMFNSPNEMREMLEDYYIL